MEAEFNIYRVGPAEKNPGPAAYDIRGSMYQPNKGVAISPRLNRQNNQTNGNYVSLPSTIGQGPKISFGYRSKELKKFIPPGPSYVPPAFGSKCPRYPFPKAPVKRDYGCGPGPAGYSVRYPSLVDSNHECTIPRSPRRTSFLKSDTNGAPLLSPRYDKVQKKAPTYPIAHKPKPRKIESSGEYVAPQSTLTKHGYDFSASSSRAPVFH